jgi:SAM-dependent methyltransferase
VELHPATRGFEGAGERYERGRPDYPAAAVDLLVQELGTKPGARVLDIGAGTGKLTRPLLERGIDVIAVEPIGGMRALLERTAPAADVRDGQAQALPLEDREVDGIVAGQAFHWFADTAALTEFARVLRPHGRLGLIWNRRDPDQPAQEAIEQIVKPYRHRTPSLGTGAWREAFTSEAPFQLSAEHEMPHSQRLDTDALVDRVLSISFIAVLTEPERESIAERVRELGPTELRYIVELHVYARRA